jgi:N-acetylglucosamine malate deacetylase 1
MSSDIDSFLNSIPELDILVFAPHPDDAEIFCGGTIALLSKKYRTGIIDLTRGENSSKGDPEKRKIETEAASEILSVHFRGNIEIPDGAVFKDHPLNIEEQIRRVCACIRMSKPSILLAPHGEHRHPDHQGAHKLVQESLFYATLRKKFTQWTPHTIPLCMYYMCRTAFKPSLIVDVTAEYQAKTDAIHAYASQISHSADSHTTLLSDPLSLASITARDAYFGSMIGAEKGEPFYITGPLPIRDPMAFLAANGPLKSFITPEQGQS